MKNYAKFILSLLRIFLSSSSSKTTFVKNTSQEFQPKTQETKLLPILRVDEVTSGSSSDVSGLHVGDMVLKFGSVSHLTSSSDTVLQDILTVLGQNLF